MGAGRPKTRSIPETPLKQAVENVGGELLAAHYAGLSQEGMRQALVRGYLSNARSAVLLAQATEAAGKPVSVAGIAGLEVINGNGSDPSEQNRGSRRGRKGVKMTATYHESRSLRPIGNPATAIAVGQN